MMGTIYGDMGASKGLITTTSDFQPGVLKADSEFAAAMPYRLELKNGAATLEWIKTIVSKAAA